MSRSGKFLDILLEYPGIFMGKNMKEKIERALNAAREEGITVNLLITEQCNFTCGHCMYSCSPQSPKGYMPIEIRNAIQEQILDMYDLDIHVSINLIGGEPTLNLDKFEEFLEWAMDMRDWYNCEIQMTTNGWWLDNPKFTKKFFKIVCTHVHDFGGIDDGFTIRVSNDKHHDPFRKTKNINASLNEVFEFYGESPLMEIDGYECINCGHWQEEEGDCEECECEDVYPNMIPPSWMPPTPNENSPWIYVEDTKYKGNVIPVGRGAKISQYEGDYFHCNAPCLHLSYKPDGSLMDVCCKGSNLPIGTVYDNPISLLTIAGEFLSGQSEQGTCRGCDIYGPHWVEENMSLIASSHTVIAGMDLILVPATWRKLND